MAQHPEAPPRWMTNPPPGLEQYLQHKQQHQQPALQSSPQSTTQLLQPALASQPSPVSAAQVVPISSPSSTEGATQVVQPATASQSQSSTKGTTKGKGLATPFTLPLWLTTSGPWESVEHAVADINRQWALCDDGVGVLHKGSQQNYLTKDHIQIQRKELYCYQKQTSQCRFRITLESRGIASSWDIAGVGPECNHPNPKTASQQNAFRIPPGYS